MPTMWEIIKAIEEAGIKVERAFWAENSHLEVITDPADHDRAIAALDAYWNNKQSEHLGLVAILIEEGESA
jgi:hypothetical protein